MRWFLALMPREDGVFEASVAHARVPAKGAEAPRELLFRIPPFVPRSRIAMLHAVSGWACA